MDFPAYHDLPMFSNIQTKIGKAYVLHYFINWDEPQTTLGHHAMLSQYVFLNDASEKKWSYKRYVYFYNLFVTI